MHICAAYQIKTGHLLHVEDDVEEVLDVGFVVFADDERIAVNTRNATSLVRNEYLLMRHEEVLVE